MKGLETAFYASVGMALKGKEKVEKWAKQVVKESKMEAGAGKKFVDNAVKHAEEAKKELSKKIDDTVKTAAGKMGFITKKEANLLKSEIEKLKKQLNFKAKKAVKTKK
ncbi:MAG: hypothetical protein FWG57_08485 [Endomicrobia bacterium]|nr:hypothetical protein [Endomicrobiia bacterium]